MGSDGSDGADRSAELSEADEAAEVLEAVGAWVVAGPGGSVVLSWEAVAEVVDKVAGALAGPGRSSPFVIRTL